MANEKPLFNKNSEKSDDPMNRVEEKHAIAKDVETDFVDFSAAFNDDAEDEDVEIEDYEDEFEAPRRRPSLLEKLPLFKKKKDLDSVKEELKSQLEETFEEDSSQTEDEDEKSEEFAEDISANMEEEKEIEKPAEDVVEDSVEEEVTVDHSADETLVSIDDMAEPEEKSDEVTVVEEEKTAEESKGKKRFSGFDFLRRKPIVKSVSEETEEIIENATETTEEQAELEDEVVLTLEETISAEDETLEETVAVDEGAKEPEIEMLPMFEETVLDEEQSFEETIETVEEPEEAEIEMLPSFEETNLEEETIEKISEEQPVEETTEEIVEEIPQFETTEENRIESEEVIEEIPPFEETIQEEALAEDSSVENNEETIEKIEKKKKKKEKKAKKEKVASESEEKQNESAVELMTTKDHVTFILIIVALLLTIAFVCVKFLPMGNNDVQNSGTIIEAGANVSEIQLQREGATGYYIQSDIEDVLYSYSQYSGFTYYQYDNKKVTPIQPSGAVNAIAEVGGEVLSVKVDYIEKDGRLFGTGVFNGSYSSTIVVFKLVNLPKGYEEDGKALLLVTTNPEAVSQRCNVWSESFIVDLATGKTTRFLSTDKNPYSTGYSILTDEGYASTDGKIPFFTARKYDAATNKRDIYLKNDSKELLFAENVAGSFVYIDGEKISFLRESETGFDVIRKMNGKEEAVFHLYNNTSYLYHNEYLLDKYGGKLYNVRTGKEVALNGYAMANPEMMTVSEDGRYLVVMGTVNSAVDYQVHIFDLKKNVCAKYEDDNFSQHKNLAFVDNKTIVYSAVEPNQGYEYTILDVSKAF